MRDPDHDADALPRPRPARPTQSASGSARRTATPGGAGFAAVADAPEYTPSGPPSREELAAWLRLTGAPGVGPATVLRLLSAFGLPEQVLAQPYAALRRVCDEATARALLAEPDAALTDTVDRTAAWVAAPGHAILTLADPAYPPRLLEIADPPPLLYLHGRPAALAMPALAVVGARHATQQGMRDAERFAEALAGAGLAIVSGLALGIDGAAHRGALLAEGTTIAVVGTGVDRVYPPAHAELATEIARTGLLVSEFPLGAPPVSDHFPRRNRLIAGLSLGVLVVEAALRSGSRITARLAAESGREVFAMPGSIHAPLAKGCHALIKQGAKLVESAQDILEELRIECKPALRDQAKPVLTPLLEGLAAALTHAPQTLDEICASAGRDAASVGAELLKLELAGTVERLAGGRYRLRA